MPTVLVVDDAAVDRRLAGGLLEAANSGLTIEYAENGAAALERIKQQTPDIVLTDLQMPHMDGLELVRTIRSRFPELPVILMTAFGSEALAVEALDQGAAGYVPKSQLADNLLGTVEQVLALARADRSYERLIECLLRTEFTFSLTNDEALIDPLVDLIQQVLAGMRVCDATGRIRVGVALGQALLNALYRGNLEVGFDAMQEEREKPQKRQGRRLADQRRSQAPYSERKIFVDVRILPEEARFTVRDEGPGFDTSVLPPLGDSRAVQQEGGRGTVLMRAFMDEVVYNEQGNQVTMVKRRDAAEEKRQSPQTAAFG